LPEQGRAFRKVRDAYRQASAIVVMKAMRWRFAMTSARNGPVMIYGIPDRARLEDLPDAFSGEAP